MKLLEIQDILYQADIKGKRHGLLYHVTSQENIHSILQRGLLPISKIGYSAKSFLGNKTIIGNLYRDNAIYLFTTPQVCLAYLKLYKDIYTSRWQTTLVEVLSIVLPLDTDITIAPENGFSEGFPNAVSYADQIPSSKIYRVDPLVDFITRFGLGGEWGISISQKVLNQLNELPLLRG